MLHQPLIRRGFAGCGDRDLGIEAAHMLRLRDPSLQNDGRLLRQDKGETIHRDFDRNKWLFAEEAIEYGCADKVLDRAPDAVFKGGRDDDDDK